MLYRVMSYTEESGTYLEFFGTPPVSSMLKCVVLPRDYKSKVEGNENFSAPLPQIFAVGEVIDVYLMEPDNVQEVPAPGGVRTNADTDPAPAAKPGAEPVSEPDAATDAEDAAVVRPTSTEPERAVYKQLKFDL